MKIEKAEATCVKRVRRKRDDGCLKDEKERKIREEKQTEEREEDGQMLKRERKTLR